MSWPQTKQWFKERSPTLTRGSHSALVAAFIACSDTFYGIIHDGIAEKPMNYWVAIKLGFIFLLAACHNVSSYTDNSYAKWRASRMGIAPTETEEDWTRRQLAEAQPKK